MSAESDNDNPLEFNAEVVDTLLDQLVERAEQRDDIDIRNLGGKGFGMSRRGLLASLAGTAGFGALFGSSMTAQAAAGSWGAATGKAGTSSNPFSEVWAATGNFETADIEQQVFEHISTPSNPASGETKLYAKSDGNLYSLQSDGTEEEVGTGAGGGGGVDVEDDGSNIVTGATAINLKDSLNVTDDGDGTVTVDVNMDMGTL